MLFFYQDPDREPRTGFFIDEEIGEKTLKTRVLGLYKRFSIC